jgi:hypothetical protein
MSARNIMLFVLTMTALTIDLVEWTVDTLRKVFGGKDASLSVSV